MLVLLVGVSPVVGNMVAAEFDIPDQWFPAVAIGYILLIALGVFNELHQAPSHPRVLSEADQVRAALLDQWREEFRVLGLRQRALLGIPWRYTGPRRRRRLGHRARARASGRSSPEHQLVQAIAVDGARNLVLTGPRGSGKTVALMLAAMGLASRPGTTLLPLMIGLRSWRGSQTSTLELAAQALMSTFSGRLSLQQAEEIVRATSTSGDLILLLDELDELEEERKVELLDTLRAHSVPFVLSSESPLLQPAFAEFADGFASLEIARVPLGEAMRYLRDSPSGVARRRLSILQTAWSNAGGDVADSPFAEPLSIGIIRDIIERTDSAAFDLLAREMGTGSANRVRAYLLGWYVSARVGASGPDEADLRAVLYPTRGAAFLWWELGDRVPLPLRVLIAVLLGAAGGAMCLFSLPLAGASLGAAFLLVRAVRSGRLPVVFSLRATIRRSLRLALPAFIGALLGLSALSSLVPDLPAGGLQSVGQGEVPVWLQLALGPGLVIAHALNSGLALVGHRGRKDARAMGSIFLGTRAFIGGVILSAFAAICLGPWLGLATATLLACFGAAMASSERAVLGLRAVTPRVSFETDRRNGWVQAAGFGVIVAAGSLAAFAPVSGWLGVLQGIALGIGAGAGNSVLTGAYGRWRLFTWPYLAVHRGHPFRVWKTVGRFHDLGIIKYSGSSILLRHSSLWSVLPSRTDREDR